jgi:hypothetical protein
MQFYAKHIYTMKHFIFLLLFSVSSSFGQEIEWVVEPKENVGLYSGELAPFFKDGKCGLVNRNGDIVLEPAYKNILTSEFSYFIASRFDEKHELINKRGEVLASSTYDMIMSYRYNIVKVKSGDKWGFMEITGKLLSLIKYSSHIEYFGGVISGSVRENGRNRFLLEDSLGRSLTSLDFEYMGSWGDGSLLPVKSSSKWGFINRKGEVIIPIEYEETSQFSEGLAAVKKDGKWGFIDSVGSIKIPFQFPAATKFSSNHCVIIQREGCSLIDTTGKTLIPASGMFMGYFTEGIVPAMKNYTQTGVINLKGETIVPFEHDAYLPMSEGLIALQKNRKWGFYDVKGNLVLPFEFESVTPFKNGEASVIRNGKGGIVKFKKI